MSDDSEVTQPSGAKRSKRMPHYSTIPFPSLRRLALRHMGAPKGEVNKDVNGFSYHGGDLGYGHRNWMRGLEMEDTLNHVIDHLQRWKDMITSGGFPDDDELSAAAWGIMGPLMTFERQYQAAHNMRINLISAAGLNWRPEDIDRQMGERGLYHWIQPLSPQDSKR